MQIKWQYIDQSVSTKALKINICIVLDTLRKLDCACVFVGTGVAGRQPDNHSQLSVFCYLCKLAAIAAMLFIIPSTSKYKKGNLT